MSKFRNQFNSHEFPEVDKRKRLPSMTIPDQSMSVKDMLDRQSRGLPVTGARIPVYHGEDDFYPDFDKMDLADREQILRDVKERIDNAREEHTKRLREYSEKKKKKEFDAMLAVHLKELASKKDEKPE